MAQTCDLLSDEISRTVENVEALKRAMHLLLTDREHERRNYDAMQRRCGELFDEVRTLRGHVRDLKAANEMLLRHLEEKL